LLYFIHDCTIKPRVIATRLAHSSLRMTMSSFCGRSTSEIRWLRNDGLQAGRRNRLISFRAGNNRSNQSFFQITDRFGRTHSSRAQVWRYRKDFDGEDRGNNQMAQSAKGRKS